MTEKVDHLGLLFLLAYRVLNLFFCGKIDKHEFEF
jgi:hypothetical protein